MKFRREARGVPQAAPKLPDSNSQAAAAAISQFYADLVQTSGVRWADANGAAPAAELSEAPAAGAAPAAAGAAAASSALERATVTPAGVVILEPHRDPGASGSGAAGAESHEPPDPSQPQHQQQPQRQQQQQGGQRGAPLAISRRNVGYQLLQKAGWTEGMGLGAQEQGRTEPLAPTAVIGQTGLGFQTAPQHPKHGQQRRQGQAAEAAAQQQQQQAGQGQQAGAQQQQQQAPKPKRPLPPDPLEKEDIDTKVKRVKQVMQTEVDEKAGKAIARYIYRAFNDATGEPTSDSNPLLRRSRLSATNPLL